MASPCSVQAGISQPQRSTLATIGRPLTYEAVAPPAPTTSLAESSDAVMSRKWTSASSFRRVLEPRPHALLMSKDVTCVPDSVCDRELVEAHAAAEVVGETLFRILARQIGVRRQTETGIIIPTRHSDPGSRLVVFLQMSPPSAHCVSYADRRNHGDPATLRQPARPELGRRCSSRTLMFSGLAILLAVDADEVRQVSFVSVT